MTAVRDTNELRMRSNNALKRHMEQMRSSVLEQRATSASGPAHGVQNITFKNPKASGE